ncbi:hypothetical protein RJC98_16645 [Pseudomonas allii]|uniref:Uncharacterized protein n=2 Tax=Pseudomonas allii TaxID=2740531 RepID=A0ACC6LFB6_9PSED|nr:hypothetical protein [Pseudomonas allii]KTB69255.1 hypothetical protein AO066_20220 [Pseudomonas fluorescens]MDR9876816.1 hypothetical protein [Pseudomonas allii]NWN48418.1 hypothetical protein [Pseudomonas allii]NWN63262.1 hypothetical protein [Pseudomonas allii]RMP85803.1 hypothetical protein ALQ17_04342 [Pseudomonas fluorescens]
MLSKTEWGAQPQTLVQKNQTTMPVDDSIDSHFFASALIGENRYPPSTPAIGTHFLAEQSEYLKSRNEKLSRGLKDLAQSKHSIKSVEVPMALVESKERLTVSVKIIKHCISMVEKTTNLQ